MKRIFNFAVSAMTFVVLGILAAPSAHAASACSNATLRGNYTATITGSIGGAPFAELDLVSSPGNGTFSGSGTVSEDGVISTVTFTATYTVNSNCTGSAVLSTGVTQNFNIQPDGSEVTFIATNSGTVVTGDAKRLSNQNGQ